MVHTIDAPARFLRLIGELERFELPQRVRILPGEAIGGRVKAHMIIGLSLNAVTKAPELRGAVTGRLVIRSTIDGMALTRTEDMDSLDIGRQATPLVTDKALKPTAWNAPKKAVKDTMAAEPRRRREAGARPRRTADAIARTSEKLRAQREARVDAVLPLVEEARASGCLLLDEICRYLDRIGHLPPRGQRWSTATLSKMLPKRTDEERNTRDAAFAALIEEARAKGADSRREIADWLNAKGHRTSRGLQWTATNILRFETTRK